MKSWILKISFFTAFSILWLKHAKADIKLPHIFSSNMVLQHDMDIPLWGWAHPGELIKVTFNGMDLKTRTSEEGEWRLTSPACDYGGPYSMEIKGKNTITLENVMIGEVWIYSGQSNREFTVLHSIESMNKINYPIIQISDTSAFHLDVVY